MDTTIRQRQLNNINPGTDRQFRNRHLVDAELTVSMHGSRRVLHRDADSINTQTHPHGLAVGIRHISKRFGSSVALNQITIDVEPGSFVVLLGPSGCGKTTLLRILAGLESADAGTISFGGRDVTHVAPANRRCAMVFQSYALFPSLTVQRNIEFAAPRSTSRAARRQLSIDLLKRVGLEAHARKYPSQLSGGQQQRVALARALAQAPTLLLLDEPLSALDAAVRHDLRQHLRNFQRETGLTTLMVTHDQEEALALADHVVVMNHGVVEQQASPVDIWNSPASLFVARFIGAMNLLPSVDIQHGILIHAPSLQQTLGFRPASARIRAPRDSDPTHALIGTITDTTFQGGHWASQIKLPHRHDSLTIHYQTGHHPIDPTPSTKDLTNQISIGSRVIIELCPSAAHRFDQHGRRIGAERP